MRSGQATIEQETVFNGVPAYKLAVTGATAYFLNGTKPSAATTTTG